MEAEEVPTRLAARSAEYDWHLLPPFFAPRIGSPDLRGLRQPPGEDLRPVTGRFGADPADEGSGQRIAAGLRVVPNTGLREEPSRGWFGGV